MVLYQFIYILRYRMNLKMPLFSVRAIVHANPDKLSTESGTFRERSWKWVKLENAGFAFLSAQKTSFNNRVA